MDNETHQRLHPEEYEVMKARVEAAKHTIQYAEDGRRLTTRIWQPTNGSYLVSPARQMYAGLTGRQRKRARKHSYKLKKVEQVIENANTRTNI